MSISQGKFMVVAGSAFSLIDDTKLVYQEAKAIYSEVAALMDVMSHTQLSGQEKKANLLAFLKGFWRYSTQHYAEWVDRISHFIDSLCKVAKDVMTIKTLVKTVF